MGVVRRACALVPLVLAVAACGGDGGGEAAKPTADETLRIMGFGPGDEIANTRAAEAARAIAPAKVRNPRGGFEDQKFLTALASGNQPDLVYLDRQKVASFAADGALQPLSDCIEREDIDMSTFREAAVEEVTYDGDVYALPEFTNQRALIVVDAVARDAGIDPKAIDTSDWERLAEQNRAMLQRSGGDVSRIGIDPKIPEFFPLWAKANGVDLLSEDGTEANLDDPKAVEALEYTVSLIEAHGGWNRFKAFRDTWDFFGGGNQVAEAQVGAWPMESWYWNVLAEASPDAAATAVPFRDREGNVLTYLSGNGWAIPRGADNPELACTWMKTMTATETWLEAARARAEAKREEGQPFTGLYTANAEADRRILDEVYEPVSPAFDDAVRLLVDIQDDAFALPASPAGAEFQQAMTDAINRVLVGAQSPREALEQAQREVEAALGEPAGG